ncbi:MAG: hypothetical protein LBJ97_00190 [Mycoplasmataceae bacterium]|jgi:aspartyl/glutamyl-tRNA(Asn/Gln) amidotransferase C subunit|nr:hypothetical protein [Mycoplasmataceae bacterium]
MKIDKREFKELAASLHFTMDNVQLDKLYQESEFLLTALENLSSLKVDDLTPMHYPFSASSHLLRDDVAIEIKEPEKYLNNAKNRFDKYVVVK